MQHVHAFLLLLLILQKSSCFLQSIPCPLVQLLFSVFVPSLFSVLFFCCICLILRMFSLGFPHAALRHAPPSQGLVTFFLQVTVILVLGEGVVVMVMNPLLFQGQSLDLELCALGLLHGLELMRC